MSYISTRGGLMLMACDMAMRMPPYEKYTTEELVKMQSQGKTLTRDEKNRVTLYAQARRKEKAKSK